MAIPNDESSLLALKSLIFDDPDKIIAKNWSISNPFCSWIGVICSKRHHRITGLNISNMNLQATIPPQLGNLSFLIFFDINKNRFHGGLPNELDNLRRLKSINLGNNNFTGSIPSFLTSLLNLQTLDLSNNEFSCAIPASVARISDLQYLEFAGRKYSGRNLQSPPSFSSEFRI
ncbi:hypothetical protein ACS0TY_006953 [Phlomoides rotata]